MAKYWALSGAHEVKPNGELRLDPCHLPQIVTYNINEKKIVATLTENSISVEYDGSGVSHLVPINQFKGVVATVIIHENGTKSVKLTLHHEDEALSIPLLVSCDMSDVLLNWRLWADIYDAPMVMLTEDGNLQRVEERSPLKNLLCETQNHRPRFLVRCHGYPLRMRLMIANRIMC